MATIKNSYTDKMTIKLKTQQWEFDPDYNQITAIEPGNCRVTIAESIYGINGRDWIANGKLMAMAPRLAELAYLVLSTATIETDAQLLKEAENIITELGNQSLDKKKR